MAADGAHRRARSFLRGHYPDQVRRSVTVGPPSQPGSPSSRCGALRLSGAASATRAPSRGAQAYPGRTMRRVPFDAPVVHPEAPPRRARYRSNTATFSVEDDRQATDPVPYKDASSELSEPLLASGRRCPGRDPFARVRGETGRITTHDEPNHDHPNARGSPRPLPADASRRQQERCDDHRLPHRPRPVHRLSARDELHRLLPAGVTRSDVAEYLSALSDRGQSGITRARKLAAIREYFRFLEGNGLLERNPTVGIETPKKERPARTTLRPGEDTKRCPHRRRHRPRAAHADGRALTGKPRSRRAHPRLGPCLAARVALKTF